MSHFLLFLSAFQSVESAPCLLVELSGDGYMREGGWSEWIGARPKGEIEFAAAAVETRVAGGQKEGRQR